jgi:hypothetical protein
LMRGMAAPRPPTSPPGAAGIPARLQPPPRVTPRNGRLVRQERMGWRRSRLPLPSQDAHCPLEFWGCPRWSGFTDGCSGLPQSFPRLRRLC